MPSSLLLVADMDQGQFASYLPVLAVLPRSDLQHRQDKHDMQSTGNNVHNADHHYSSASTGEEMQCRMDGGAHNEAVVFGHADRRILVAFT